MKIKSKRRRSENSIANQLTQDALDYIKESRNYIYFVISLFVVFTLIGFFIVPGIATISSFINNSLKSILLKTENLSGIQLILYIFVNNLTVSFYSILFGILGGIYPIFSSVANGTVLGYVLAKVYAVTGISDFWRILPHGIFELPAVFISLGLGLKLGMFLFSKNPLRTFKYRLINSIKVILLIIIPLLIVAAIIEGLLITLFK